ncbi:tol-pal system YbgF family protein [Undibacterium flavidum]|uniref:Tetratricopeptide repeat protein n=1 Tax=Undibacterium flavidum TaxID=2762297 RepID=A0ABR6YHL1_9BURK|nr:hypothetical protein [Undibacterium flavidum]MBC3876027.1 hypothetical protein [Undibacterium flavidum]
MTNQKMLTHIRHFILIVLLNTISLSAISQERLPCQWGNIDVTDPACERPQVILKNYRNASTYAEHQSLMTALNQLRNDDFQRQIAAKRKVELYDPFIDEALMAWLDWYQAAFTARTENRQLLDSEVWRSVIQLAHRDPYAAIRRLNKTSLSTNENDSALSLLLTGMLMNRLNILAEAANYASFDIKTNDKDEQKRSQRFSNYVEQHKLDFNTGETCYGGNYTGRHFAAIVKQYPQSSYAQGAAYLAMSITPCGECEGDFACYLSKGLAPTKEFLQKYPQSTYVPMLLKRAQNLINGQFIAKEAQADYLTKNDPKSGEYTVSDVVKVLIDFENDLKHIAPSELIDMKFLLADLYVKLKQYGNAKRVMNWLTEYAPDSVKLSQLRQSLHTGAIIKRLEDVKQIAERKKKLMQNYWSQKCELDKSWLGQEGIDCQEVRLNR